MSSRRPTSKLRIVVPAILMTAAGALLALGMAGTLGRELTAAEVYHKMVLPLLRLIFYLAAGLMAGLLIENAGWTRKLARWVSPLIRPSNLPSVSAAAFVASFVSGILANTMLMEFHQAGKLTRRELVLSYLVNNGIPIFLVHLPTTAMIVVSLAGPAGLIYPGITFSAACLRTAGVLVFARLTLPDTAMDADSADGLPNGHDKKLVRSLMTALWDRFARLVMYTVPIYVLIFLCVEFGFFNLLRTAVTGRLSAEFFPVEAAGIVVFTVAAEFGSGMAAAGALLNAGTLTVKQAACALIAGTVAAAPIRAVRHQLPTHAGIFSLGLGSELLFLSQLLRTASLIAVTIPYALW
ncbi:MAG: nucleoside recognition domain-containing protein [Pseudomonadota bacterium]